MAVQASTKLSLFANTNWCEQIGNHRAILEVALFNIDGRQFSLIEHLYVPRPLRSQGIGRRLMERLCSSADELGIDLILECVPLHDRPLTKEQLRDFYMSLGFEIERGPCLIRPALNSTQNLEDFDIEDFQLEDLT